MTREEKQINYDSDEAASIQTVTGWVSSKGHFWGKDERMARYDGSTHRVCEKNPSHGMHRTNGWCDACWEEKLEAKWQAMPRREYDGSPVCAVGSDSYFFEPYEIIDWLQENDIKPEDARLVFCKPNYLSQISSDQWADDLPEDGDLSGEVWAALEALNKVIAAQPPSSWSEGNEAVVLPTDFLEAK